MMNEICQVLLCVGTYRHSEIASNIYNKVLGHGFVNDYVNACSTFKCEAFACNLAQA